MSINKQIIKPNERQRETEGVSKKKIQKLKATTIQRYHNQYC